jgi:glyoxylase-like metal-dependent hydrolase (beta-lactamase superfamily II)
VADLLELSARIIDSGVPDDPQTRITQELSEVTDRIAVIESFSHVVLVRTGDGLVAFDTSGQGTGAAVVDSLRHWSSDPITHVVYTHGHADHVGGSPSGAATTGRSSSVTPTSPPASPATA